MKVQHEKRRLTIPVAALSCMLLIAVIVQFDYVKMSSGVFRKGKISKGDEKDILYRADGKISTVIAREHKNGADNTIRVISNNGKSDAAVQMTKGATSDEPTMNLLAVLPLMYNQKSTLRVANIGFGSGLTAEMLLTEPRITELDTIEIEPKVIEAGKAFYPKVDKVFTDNRNNFVIDDAKTHFAAKGIKYDIIVAEPPNPWVSGVSSLFTKEWYAHVNNYLANDGVYIQWVQIYELNTELLSTIYNALHSKFKYIDVYAISQGVDFGFIASNKKLKRPAAKLSEETLKRLQPLGINSYDDLISLRYIANQTLLDNFFATKGLHAINSDYFPILDNGAAKSRFMGQAAQGIPVLTFSRILQQITTGYYFIDKPDLSLSAKAVDGSMDAEILATKKKIATFLRHIDGSLKDYSKLSAKDFSPIAEINSCSEKYTNSYFQQTWLTKVISIFNHVSKDEIKSVINAIKEKCRTQFDQESATLLESISLYCDEDYSTLRETLSKLLDTKKLRINSHTIFAIKLYLAASIETKQFDREKITRIYSIIREKKITNNELDILFYMSLIKKLNN